jgi:hypothetical protein
MCFHDGHLVKVATATRQQQRWWQVQVCSVLCTPLGVSHALHSLNAGSTSLLISCGRVSCKPAALLRCAEGMPAGVWHGFPTGAATASRWPSCGSGLIGSATVSTMYGIVHARPLVLVCGWC